MRSLDISLLRTLIAVDQHGSFARARRSYWALAIGCEPSAEAFVAASRQPSFSSCQKRMALTEAGQTLRSGWRCSGPMATTG